MNKTKSKNLELRIKEAEDTNYLDLDNLKLEVMPDLSSKFKNINYLFINNNNLKIIDLSFFQSLSVVDISDNPIKEINYLPSEIQELNCNNCNIEKICEHQIIKKIHCENNKITIIEKYPLLEDLQCGKNKIKYISSLEKLKDLSCFENPITKIDFLPNLKILNCDKTLLEGEINFAPLLTHLTCNDTKISDISKLNKLNEIEFYNSHINEIPFLSELKLLFCNNINIKLSSKYKIKNLINVRNKINVVFE